MSDRKSAQPLSLELATHTENTAVRQQRLRRFGTVCTLLPVVALQKGTRVSTSTTAWLPCSIAHAPTHPRSKGIRAQDLQQVVLQFWRRKRLCAELRESGGVFGCEKMTHTCFVIRRNNGQPQMVLTCRCRVERLDRDALLPPGR